MSPAQQANSTDIILNGYSNQKTGGQQNLSACVGLVIPLERMLLPGRTGCRRPDLCGHCHPPLWVPSKANTVMLNNSIFLNNRNCLRTRSRAFGSGKRGSKGVGRCRLPLSPISALVNAHQSADRDSYQNACLGNVTCGASQPHPPTQRQPYLQVLLTLLWLLLLLLLLLLLFVVVVSTIAVCFDRLPLHSAMIPPMICKHSDQGGQTITSRHHCVGTAVIRSLCGSGRVQLVLA